MPEEQRRLRKSLRKEHGWDPEDKLLLFVGSDFQRKGVDRILHGMAALQTPLRQQIRLVLLGQCEPGRFAHLARRLGLADRAHFMGGRIDAPDWMLASDLLVHPARVETAGAVLVEAMTHGLPVLTTEACGYAFHIEKGRAGIVIPEPFSPLAFSTALEDMLSSPTKRGNFSRRALHYAATEDLYHCHQKAADIIEDTARNKSPVYS